MIPTTTRPNVLIIHTDQHRADCLGAYGNPNVETPNLDALTGDGVRYTNSFCPFPVCTPSRYSLLTGQYVHQHLGWSNHCTLPAGIPTFARMLKQAGYRTAAIGKMHFTPTYLDVGFERMILAEQDGPGRFDDDYHRWLRDEGLFDGVDLMDQRREYREEAPDSYWESFGALTSDLDEAHHSTAWIADKAMEELGNWKSGGNLLMVGFIKPHHPFDPPAPWDSMYSPETLEILPGWLDEPLERDLERHEGYFPHRDLTEAKLRTAMALYYATISQIDYHIGRMVDHLRKNGIFENTLIVYTSDHGDYLGFHHLLLKGNNMYDPLVKVPLIIKYPEPGDTARIEVKHPEPGTVSEDLVSNVDLAPTILAAGGVEIPASMTGFNLASGAERSVVFAEAEGPMGRGKQYMARTRSHKLLECAASGASQLYDLAADPLEMINRTDDRANATQAADLREALYRWLLFDSPSRTHLNPDAPAITGKNLPEDLAESAHAVEEYYRQRMSE